MRWKVWLRTWKAASKQREKPKAPDGLLDFDAYGRNVNLYFSGAEHREFKKLTEELASNLGTRNQSDTVLSALRRLNHNQQVLRLVSRSTQTR